MSRDNAQLLKDMSREALASYIADYMDKDAGKVTNDAAEIVHAFAELDDEGREYVLSALRAFFCSECGSARLPCYCMRDD